MNKKFVLVGLIALAVLVLFLAIRFIIVPPLSDAPGYMKGKVIGVGSSTIVVEGTVYSSELPDARSEERIIEFYFDKSTVFINMAYIITQENLDSGQPYQPKMEEKRGKFSDLTEGTSIIRILSRDDLYTAKEAVISEISYHTYEFPLLTQ